MPPISLIQTRWLAWLVTDRLERFGNPAGRSQPRIDVDQRAALHEGMVIAHGAAVMLKNGSALSRRTERAGSSATPAS
jgi:hypothetical protein